MKVLSLFDGMSCSRIALERAGIKVDNYFASEVDKYAIKVTMANYPDTVQLGDARKVKADDLPKIDLLLGGSPCQGFSQAGKGGKFNDPRSKLFWEYVRVLNECRERNPDILFLLENVRMDKYSEGVISDALGLDPVLINSALVSAQNRERLYWSNIRTEEHTMFGHLKTAILQPEDRGILLKDILEDAGADKDKAYCIRSNYATGGTYEQYKSRRGKQLVCIQIGEAGPYQGDRIYSPEGKAPCLAANKGNKSGGSALVSCIQIGKADLNGHDYNRRVYSPEGKGPSLAAKSGGNLEPKVSQDNLHWRKLTPLECERLQTVPDNYTKHVSNTQRYKMLGNGWTVDVIAHIFSFLPERFKSAM